MAKKIRNVNRLLKEMKKFSVDVNDNEICKKFETLIKSGNEEDIPHTIITQIINDPFEVNEKEIAEIYVMYFRHYRFMRKRQKKIDAQQADTTDSSGRTSKRAKSSTTRSSRVKSSGGSTRKKNT